MELKPLLAARASHAVLGAVAGICGLGVWQDDGLMPEPVATVLAAALVGLGALVVVRSMRMGVECRNGAVRVRGLLLSRTVPRASIEDITPFPALRWRDSDGRRRWTPLVFLMDSSRGSDSFRRHNAGELTRLRRWVRRDA